MMMIVCITHFKLSFCVPLVAWVDRVVQKGSYININECLYTYTYIRI